MSLTLSENNRPLLRYAIAYLDDILDFCPTSRATSIIYGKYFKDFEKAKSIKMFIFGQQAHFSRKFINTGGHLTRSREGHSHARISETHR